MHGVIIYLATGAAVVLACCTLYLVSLNWSEKLYGPIVSILLGGTVTSLIAVIVVLKESVSETHWTSSILFDERNGYPPMCLPPDGPMQERQNSYASLMMPMSMQDGKTLTLAPPAKSPAEMDVAGAELIQYMILSNIWTGSRGGSRLGFRHGVLEKPKISRPYKPSDIQKVLGTDASRSIKKSNRYFEAPMEKMKWDLDVAYLNLPEGTSFRLEHMPSSPETGAERRIVIIEKPRYFEIAISIVPMGSLSPGAVYEGFNVKPEDIKHVRTMPYEIEVKATFHKYTAGNWRTEEYKKWTEWLTAYLKEALAD